MNQDLTLNKSVNESGRPIMNDEIFQDISGRGINLGATIVRLDLKPGVVVGFTAKMVRVGVLVESLNGAPEKVEVRNFPSNCLLMIDKEDFFGTQWHYTLDIIRAETSS